MNQEIKEYWLETKDGQRPMIFDYVEKEYVTQEEFKKRLKNSLVNLDSNKMYVSPTLLSHLLFDEDIDQATESFYQTIISNILKYEPRNKKPSEGGF